MNIKVRRKREGHELFHVFNYIILGFVFLIVAYPIYFILIASISDPSLVNTGQITLIPRNITIEGYVGVFSDDSIMNGYKNSLIYTTLAIISPLWMLFLQMASKSRMHKIRKSKS